MRSLTFRYYESSLEYPTKTVSLLNEHVPTPFTKHIMTVRISPGNCKAAETETACDKIGRPNQSETTGNCQGKRIRGRRAYAEKEIGLGVVESLTAGSEQLCLCWCLLNGLRSGIDRANTTMGGVFY